MSNNGFCPVEFCDSIVIQNVCTTEELKQNFAILQELLNRVCAIECPCLPDCIVEPQTCIFDGFTGTEIDLSAKGIDTDPRFMRVYQNGLRLSPSDNTGVRDYTFDGSTLTFQEAKGDCRIVIDYFTCADDCTA